MKRSADGTCGRWQWRAAHRKRLGPRGEPFGQAAQLHQFDAQRRVFVDTRGLEGRVVRLAEKNKKVKKKMVEFEAINGKMEKSKKKKLFKKIELNLKKIILKK